MWDVTHLLEVMDIGWIEVCLLNQIHRGRNGTQAETIESGYTGVHLHWSADT
jgi:hypothetical protein